MYDSSPKENQIEESQLYEDDGDLDHRGAPLNESNYSKADYSLASAKPAEGSADVRSCPQARKPTSIPANPDSEQVQEVLVERLSVEIPEHLPVPVPDPPAAEAPRPARAKPWTADELQTVRDGSAYREGDTPPDNFPSNCELRQMGTPPRKSSHTWDRSLPKNGIDRRESEGPQAGTGFTLSRTTSRATSGAPGYPRSNG